MTLPPACSISEASSVAWASSSAPHGERPLERRPPKDLGRLDGPQLASPERLEHRAVGALRA